MRAAAARMLTVLAAAGLVAACTPDEETPARSTAEAGEVQIRDDGVTVEAVGTVEGTPDMLTASVGVEVRADDVDTAYTDGNEAAAAVRDALVEQGVDAADVQTAQLSLGPDRRRGPDDNEVDAYVARTSLRADLRDLDTAGETIDAAVAAAGDAATLHSVGFSLDDDSDLVVDARERAFDEARAKAEQYAGLADRSLGELVGLAESDSPHSQPPRPLARQEAALDDAAGATVEPGQEEVQVRVRATWALE